MENSLNNLIIETERLVLRAMTLDDADAIFLIRSDPETVKYTPIEPETDVEQSREWIRKKLTTGDDFNFVMELRAGGVSCSTSDTIIGSLNVIGFIGGPRLPELGFGVNRLFWSKGYMTEALKGLCAAYWSAFPDGYPGLEGERKHMLTADTDRRNRACRAVLEKCGFAWWKEEEAELKGEKITEYWYRMWRPGSPM